MNKVLITGANGFVGSNLCRHFLDRGWEVHGLVRPTSDLRFLSVLDVRLIRGDLSVPGGAALPAGVPYVVHSASIVSDVAGDAFCDRHIYGLAVNLVRLLRERGGPLRRLVEISTSLTLGYAATGISDESPGRSAESMPYVRHKIRTERYLLDEHAARGLPVVILRPADIFGPRDRTTCLRILQGCAAGVPLIVGRGRWRFGLCYVGNLCQAVELALTREGIEGRAYTVTNGVLPTWREFFEAIQRGLGRRQRIAVPKGAAYAAAALVGAVKAFRPGWNPPLTRYRIRRITTDTTYDISRTVAELGYRPDDDYRRQFEEIVRWYLEEGGNAGSR